MNKEHSNPLVDGIWIYLLSFILKPKKDIASEVVDIIKSHEKDIDEYEKVR